MGGWAGSLSDCGTLGRIAPLESRMPHIQGHARNQSLLLPAAIDDYVGADNPVRFIEAFADQLDLEAAGFGPTRS